MRCCAKVNEYYQPGDQRAARVRDLFSVIASRYDLINDLQSFGLHRLWKRRLLDSAQARPGSRVLDLCCGTGDVALHFATHGCQVMALDFSEPMLAIARQRAKARGLSIDFVRGDALQLPFSENEFDAVTISYGLRNLADIQGGLREMVRVTKPGGRILVLDFGKPSNRLVRTAYFTYLKYCVPWFGRVLCQNPAAYAYILESLRDYPAQEGIAEFMTTLGCQNARIINLLGGIMIINSGQKPTPERQSTSGPVTNSKSPEFNYD